MGAPTVTRHLKIAAALIALVSTTASADTLREALVLAYQANPTLTAQRESLKATDSSVAIARAAGSGVLGEGRLTAKQKLSRDIDRGEVAPPGIGDSE